MPIQDENALVSLVERSHDQSTVVFLHDPYCPISRRAYRELASLPHEVAVVDVTREPAISRTIEQRTGVRHESLQVLVFRAGRVAWSASHSRITRRAVARAMDPAAAERSEPAGVRRGRGELAQSPGLLTALRWALGRQ